MTEHPGVGVILAWLRGNADSVDALNSVIGKKIVALALVKGAELLLTFTDGLKLSVYDGGQSCCEHRYMTTDDSLDDFVGAELLGAEIADGPGTGDEWGDVHEVQFLKVATSKGVFTVETHNEHNGYYGGFAIRCRLVPETE